MFSVLFFFFFQAEDGIRDADVTGVQTCALPISSGKTEREDETHAEKLQSVGGRREAGRNGRVQDPELLAFLALFHAFGELRGLEPFAERGVELPGCIVISGDLEELLF